MKTVILNRAAPNSYSLDPESSRDWVFQNGRLAMCYGWGNRLGLSDSVKVEVSERPLARGKLLKIQGKLRRYSGGTAACVDNLGGNAASLDGENIEDVYTGLIRAARRLGFDREQCAKGIWIRFKNIRAKKR